MRFYAGTTITQRREEKRLREERRDLHFRLRSLKNQRWPTGSVVYFIGCGEFVKIGISTDLKSRFFALQQTNPVELELLAYVYGGRDRERAYHHRFADVQRCYEWFHRTTEIEAEIARLNDDYGRAVA